MAFTVFASPRPIRTAFLVNSIGERSSQRLIDAIIDGVICFSNGIANKIFGVPARINIDSLFSVKLNSGKIPG
jgi:hypothetical protein